MYVDRLVALSADRVEQQKQGFDTLSSGWAIGTAGWRKAVAKDHVRTALSPAIEASQLREFKMARWTKHLARLMEELGKVSEDIRTEPKSAPWKISLAARLRKEEGASVEWIAHELMMGKSHAVRSYLSRAENVV